MLHYGQTRIVICKDEHDLGARAASAVSAVMRELLASGQEIRMVFAAGESQTTFLAALCRQPGIDWQRVVCFNMDDFWDPRMPEQFTCGCQTRTQLYDKVRPRQFHLVGFNAPDAEAEARRFAGLLAQAGPIHILCQGIGTSGHLALNEPGATDFEDPEMVRVVDLVEQSKRQLLADPNFKDLGYIPHQGITMTIPALLAAAHVFTMVPLGLKRDILTRLLAHAAPTSDLPATILSRYPGELYVDRNSCPRSLIENVSTEGSRV
jgi:glucosamine-6-phosphate deaminase